MVLVFGFSNIFANFLSYTNENLIKKLNLFVIMHLNNILILTKNVN